MTAGQKGDKPRGTFVPEGFKTRIEALTSLIRFGPGLLPNGEFLALLFHAERALTYGKKSDAASLSQITDGIRRKNGAWIRGGAGIGKSTAAAANAQLEGHGLLKRRQRVSARRGHQATEYEIRWGRFAELLKYQGSGDTLVRLMDKPLSNKRTSPCSAKRQALSDKRTHRGNSSSEEKKQRKGSQRGVADVQGSPPGATSTESPKPFPKEKDDDDEKPKISRPPLFPEAEFKARLVERHGDSIDVAKVLADVESELNGIPLAKFLKLDLNATTAPDKLKNPHGYYRQLARTLAEQKLNLYQDVDLELLSPDWINEALRQMELRAEAERRERRPHCCNDGVMADGSYCTCKVGPLRKQCDDYNRAKAAAGQQPSGEAA